MRQYRDTFKHDNLNGLITKYKEDYFIIPLIAEGWGRRAGPVCPDLVAEFKLAPISVSLYEWLGIPKLLDSELKPDYKAISNLH